MARSRKILSIALSIALLLLLTRWTISGLARAFLGLRAPHADDVQCISRSVVGVALLQLPACANAMDMAVEANSNMQLAAVGVGLLLAFIAAGYSSSSERPRDGTQRAGNFHYLVNRGSRNFDAAFLQIAAQNPDSAGNTVFTYFDTFGDQNLPDLPSYSRKVELIGREVTNQFDDKRSLALSLQAAGCESAFAPTYLSADDALKATEHVPDALFFAKLSHEQGGKGVQVVTRQELRRGTSARHDVIQRAVQDLALIDGRKFVVRFFALIHDKAVYVHQRCCCVVHGAPYERDSVDYKVQICHDWYAEGADSSTAGLMEMRLLPDGAAWQRSVAQRVAEMTPALQPLLDASSADRYAVIGGDALIEDSGEARLIELNMLPCLWAEKPVFDVQVATPMLRDFAKKILLGLDSPGLQRLAPS